MERLLRDEGFDVLHARDGSEGIQKAIEQRDRLDLVLLDINLPGMDGYEAATKIKAIEGFDSIPIVAVTVNALTSDRKRSLAAGCDGFILKPIDIHSFPTRVREYIGGRRKTIRGAEERYYLREHSRRLVDRLESSLGQLRVTSEQVTSQGQARHPGRDGREHRPRAQQPALEHLLRGSAAISPNAFLPCSRPPAASSSGISSSVEDGGRAARAPRTS